MHLPDKRHVPGILQHYDLRYNVAVVIIKEFRSTRTAIINNKVKTGTHSEVLAIGRVYESGKLMAASGIMINKESELDCKELRISTCQITKVSCVSSYYIYLYGENMCNLIHLHISVLAYKYHVFLLVIFVLC